MVQESEKRPRSFTGLDLLLWVPSPGFFFRRQTVKAEPSRPSGGDAGRRERRDAWVPKGGAGFGSLWFEVSVSKVLLLR